MFIKIGFQKSEIKYIRLYTRANIINETVYLIDYSDEISNFLLTNSNVLIQDSNSTGNVPISNFLIENNQNELFNNKNINTSTKIFKELDPFLEKYIQYLEESNVDTIYEEKDYFHINDKELIDYLSNIKNGKVGIKIKQDKNDNSTKPKKSLINISNFLKNILITLEITQYFRSELKAKNIKNIFHLRSVKKDGEEGFNFRKDKLNKI